MDPFSGSRVTAPPASSRTTGQAAAPVRRPPGRPALMTREAVLERIRALSERPDGLFRVHLRHPALYARARRMFGSWGAAVSAAGIDHAGLTRVARLRAARTRRKNLRRGAHARLGG